MGYPNEDEGPDEVTWPAERALSACPFCQGAVQFRKALHICDGNTDAIIHAAPTNCGMVQFEDGSTDESIIEKWNTRSINAIPDLAKVATASLRDRCREALAEMKKIERNMEQGVLNRAHIKRWDAMVDYLVDFVHAETGRGGSPKLESASPIVPCLSG